MPMRVSRELDLLTIRVPSVIVPSEANILINPVHPDAARITLLARNPFSLDPRLFR
jgi:RES domain-containing protein